MPDTMRSLERAREDALRLVREDDPFGALVGFRDRRRRNRRITAATLALALVVAGLGTAIALSQQPHRVTIGGELVGTEVNGPCLPGQDCWDMDVYIVRSDGSDLRRVGFETARDLATSWSPDGERIAFVAADGEDDERSNVYTMAVDGSDVRQLTTGSQLDLFPVYSPDGARIAFMSDRSGVVEVYVMNVDGSDPVAITAFDDGGLDDYHPAWSPDGSQIAFVRGEVPPGADGELWVVDADGSNPHQVLVSPRVSFPSWSPDGSRIAFGTGTWPDVRLGILDLESGTVSDLGEGYMPHWSPDGRWLELSIPDPGSGFAIMQVADPSRRQILRSSGWAGSWSPDGEWIVFSDAPPMGTDAGDVTPSVGHAVAGWLDDGTPYLVVRHEDGTLTAVEAISPHLAAGGIRKLIGWCVSSQTFDDPFHGSRFDGYGRYLSGPSPRGLVRFEVQTVDEPPGFRLGDALPPRSREETGTRAGGELCFDTEVTPLVMPGTVELSAMDPTVPATPEALIALTSGIPFGSRWEIDATLLLRPEGTASLCAEVQGETCVAGAPVEGPSIHEGDPLAVPGRWLVLVRDGVFVDPIRAG